MLLLLSIFLVLLFSILFCIISTNLQHIKFISVLSTAFVLSICCFLILFFDCNLHTFQYCFFYSFNFDFLNLKLNFGLDGFSLWFFSLSSLLIFLCILFTWEEVLFKEYAITLLVLNLLLLLVFSVLDLLFFYIFFEAILIPMFLMIGFWGSRERKILAAYLFFFYTLMGSLLMLVGLIYIYKITGTFNYESLIIYQFSFSQQFWLWLAFFLSFASKIPLFPLHI